MTLNTVALWKLLCERLCEEVSVEERPDGWLIFRNHFEFPGRDQFPIHLSKTDPGEFSYRTAVTHSCISAARAWIQPVLLSGAGMNACDCP